MPGYATLEVSVELLESFGGNEFSFAERRRFLRALRLLDENERHRSLRVHALKGDKEGLWSASACDELRITFRRLPNGRKAIVECSRHYGD
jgi:plasmid maintenance system killer protein